MRRVSGFVAMIMVAAAASGRGGMSVVTAPTPASLPNGWHLRTDSPKENLDATTTHIITDWTASPAINAQDAGGPMAFASGTPSMFSSRDLRKNRPPNE